MYGVSPNPSPRAAYDWGADPCRGDPGQWWAYHQPIYEQCRRVLRPGGTAPKYLKVHPCPKAVEEMQFLAEALSRPGDIVLDPFCGSGSTLVAAKKLGRHYIGCDLSEKYCRLAKYRLSLVK
jgi:DNA modification methylase